MRGLRHIGIVGLGLLLCLVLPGLFYVDLGGLLSGTIDAVSGASMELPEQPSGEFIVIINADRHPATIPEWSDFFLENEVGVIMEDIRCMAAASDPTGVQLAERYQARLAENQMELTRENGLLIVSKAENGLYDVIILSKEMADAYDYSAVFARGDAEVITVKGAAQ